MVDRPDTPWYSTLRLFRQTRRGDWNDLLLRVASELDTHIASHTRGVLTKEVLA